VSAKKEKKKHKHADAEDAAAATPETVRGPFTMRVGCRFHPVR